MKRSKNCIRVLHIFVFAACICFATNSFPEETRAAEKPAIICESWEDLKAALASDPGGAISMEGEGEILADTSYQVDGQETPFILTKPVEVDLGKRGLCVSAHVEIIGEVAFYGSGEIYPVVYVQSGGALYAEAGSITATGASAVALSLDGDGSIDLPGFLVQATGENAIALDIRRYVNEEMDWVSNHIALKWMRLRASAENGVAVACAGNTVLALYYSFVEGALYAEWQADLYGCLLSETPANALIHPMKVGEVYIDEAQNTRFMVPMHAPIVPPKSVTHILNEVDTWFFDVVEGANVEWDVTEVDNTTPGRYRVTGRVERLVSGLEIEDFYTFEVPYDVYDSQSLYLPYAEYISYGMGGTFLVIPVLPGPEEAGVEGLISLYHSSDEGKTWEKLLLAGGEDKLPYEAGFRSFSLRREEVSYIEDGNAHWFYTELIEGGVVTRESDPLRVTFDGEKLHSEGIGGDRDMGDRDNDDNGSDGIGGGSDDDDRLGPASPFSFVNPPENVNLDPPPTQPVSAQNAAQPQEEEAPEGGQRSMVQFLDGQRYTQQQILDLVAANPESITFFINDAKLVFPTEVLAALAAEGGDLLIAVDLTQTGMISIRLFIGDEEIEKFSDSISVFIPWRPEEGMDALYFVLGEEWILAQVENGIAAAPIMRTGTYRLVAQGAAMEPPQEALLQDEHSKGGVVVQPPALQPELEKRFPFAAAAGTLVFTGGAGAAGASYLRRRKWHRRQSKLK